MAGRDFIVKPTIFSGINNTGEYVLTSHIRPKTVNDISGIVEGYSPLSYDQTPQITLINNQLSSRKNPLLFDPLYYPNFNWDKTKFNLLFTEVTSYVPMRATSAYGQSQINGEIMDNADMVPVPGLSSTITIQFSKRPGVVQQFIYQIPNLDTSAYVMWRPGADSGATFGYNERHFEFSGGQIPGASIFNPSPVSVGDYKASTCHHHNPTRGGATTLFRPVEFAHDTTWPTSVTSYRNYYTGTCPNNVVSAEFKSCAIPFDFVSYSGEATDYTSQEKLGNQFNQALWKNMRMYENFTVNYSGMEGVMLHEMWSYNDKVPPNDERAILKYLMTTQFDIGFAHLYDKIYTYNPIRNELYDIDLTISGGHASGIGNEYRSTTVSAMYMPLHKSNLLELNEYPLVYEYESWIAKDQNNIPAARFYDNYIWRGGTKTPTVLENPPWADETTNIISPGSQWNTTMSKPSPQQRGVSGFDPDLYTVYYRNNTYGLNYLDGTTNYYPANTPWYKGTLFFNWEDFRVGTKYYMSGVVYNNQSWIDTSKYYFDRSLYYSIILEKSANNFVTNTRGGKRPYVASGPLCVGILAKGDTNPANYDFFNPTGIIYNGNGLDGDWNHLSLMPRKILYQAFVDAGHYDTSSDGSCEINNHHEILLKIGKTELYARKRGWIKSRYFMIVGKDKDDVKSKIDLIISSGVLNTPQGMDKIPEYVLDSIPKKNYE